jgi:hypothetical protein
VASEQDAARDRVLAARAELGEQVQVLEASARAAVDVPARIKRNPAKAAAVVGTAGFIVLKGPQRLFRAARRRITGEREPLPKRLLPDEIEKTLKKLGDDGDKVRATLERDFAGYVHKHEKERRGAATAIVLAAARPLLIRGAKSVAQALTTPDSSDFGRRLAEIRARAEGTVDTVRDRAAEGIGEARDRAAHGAETVRDRAAEGAETVREGAERAKDAAQDRLSSARRDAPDPPDPGDRGAAPS